MDLSIIILNYKSKSLVLNCIKSIKEADFVLGDKKLSYEIIVVDNASDDNIGELLSWQFTGIKFLQNTSNVGMGAGNNVGIKRAQGEYIVVMNPDTIAFPDTFKKLYRYMEENKRVGVIGPKQLNVDKSIQNSCFRWPKLFTPIFRRTPLGNFKFAKKELSEYLMEDFDHEVESDVDWLLGSFLFVRSEAIKEVGMFDERFFMYFEDTDFCKRFWEKGWKVVYYPFAEIIHNHLRQSAQAEWYNFLTNKATRWHISSWLKYLIKWRGR